MRVTDWSQWGRAIDYLFGRNALIGLASLMLLIISGYATWAGMNDFIVGAASSHKGRDVPGGFNVSHTNLVIMVTIALTFLMWIALRETIGRGRHWYNRVITGILYVFLVLWSVGFGYGFWWSLIAGEEATRSSLAALQEDARDAGNAISARLDAVKGGLDAVVTWSDGQMEREEKSGGSCGVASGAGRGPLYNARKSVRDGVSSLRDTVNKNWLVPAQADLDILRKSAADFESANPDERQKKFEAAATTIRSSAKNIATRSNELGASTAAEMRALAAAVSKKPGEPGFACNDPTLAQRLTQAAEQASIPTQLQLRDVAYNEGPAGVANAVKNLWQNLGAYTTSLARYIFGSQTTDYTKGGEPITGRDMIALMATIGIDLGLFVLALLDRPGPPPANADGLTGAQSRLHRVDATTRRELEAAFRTAVARAPDVNMEWVRRHFVHHNSGSKTSSWVQRPVQLGGSTSGSYFVIPNLYGVEKGTDDASKIISKREELWALALNQLAGVMEDLKLIRAVTPNELKGFLEEESRSSNSDLSIARQKWREKNKDKNVADPNIDVTPIRNHGLLSKAERALDIAGWSPKSVRDLEVFKLVDIDGLTPLLSLLNDATLDAPAAMVDARPNPLAPAPGVT
jgi:hypothetical protein